MPDPVINPLAEAKRLVEEQLLRATEHITSLLEENTNLTNQVRAYEAFYKERDTERANLLAELGTSKQALAQSQQVLADVNSRIEDMDQHMADVSANVGVSAQQKETENQLAEHASMLEQSEARAVEAMAAQKETERLLSAARETISQLEKELPEAKAQVALPKIVN